MYKYLSLNICLYNIQTHIQAENDVVEKCSDNVHDFLCFINSRFLVSWYTESHEYCHRNSNETTSPRRQKSITVYIGRKPVDRTQICRFHQEYTVSVCVRL